MKVFMLGLILLTHSALGQEPRREEENLPFGPRRVDEFDYDWEAFGNSNAFSFSSEDSFPSGNFSSSGMQSSTLGNCKKSDFSCGECETDLQNDLNSLMGKITGGGFSSKDHWGDGKESHKTPGHIAMAPNVTLDDTLQQIILLFKKHNPAGDNKLNFVVIGESESLQASSIKDGKIYPRVMLKSPNSELMVTFNTDPAAKGYKTLEMMRWNGRKGRYEFQELNFGEQGDKPHVDVTGNKCIECHKSPSPRPNWDTYRAWAGVVPSRDDMLEKHGNSKQFDHAKGMQPDARAYLNFLDQVASEKDAGKSTRLAMLDIPFDEKRQLSSYLPSDKKKLTAREQVEIIKRKIDKDGFYRIKHFPDKEEPNPKVSMNFDVKTAPYSGPSQFAFDQMLAQNMCRVQTDLKAHPDFEKFKYPLALMIKCGTKGRMGDIYPPSFKDKVLDYYANSQYKGLGDISAARHPKEKVTDFSTMHRLVLEDTQTSHDNVNGFKFNRHERFLTSYLEEVEKRPKEESSKQAKYYSNEIMTPTLPLFHAIGDEGGVKGVPENATEIVTDVRLLLEPFGVPVSHWSLVHGKNTAYNSFSFSDQFVLFEEQPLFNELLKEAGSCAELEKRSKLALSEVRRPASLAGPDIIPQISLLCNTSPEVNSQNAENFNQLGEVMVANLKQDMKKSMNKCLSCHDAESDIEFPGFRDFVKSGNERPFTQFLNSTSQYYQRPMIEIFEIKLGTRAAPVGKDYGSDMPPSKWSDNADFAAKHGIDAGVAHDVRRKQLATFLSFIAAADGQDVKSFCNKINDDAGVKNIKSNTPSPALVPARQE